MICPMKARDSFHLSRNSGETWIEYIVVQVMDSGVFAVKRTNILGALPHGLTVPESVLKDFAEGKTVEANHIGIPVLIRKECPA